VPRRAVVAVALAALHLASAAAADLPMRASVANLAARPIVMQVTVGEVAIEGWDRSGVEVQITGIGEAAAAGALDVALEDAPQAVTVRAVQRNGGKDPDLRVRVAARVPARATLQRVDVVDGSLDLEGLHGDIRASIERGPVTARRLAGLVRIETGSGDITVSDAELTPGGLLRLRAFTGNVALGLSKRPTDARVLALTFNGSIQSELPLSERPGFGRRFREGVIGKGEPLISIDVVRGDISLTVLRK
jgi:hypothetical protein